ncbi:MAG TPA: ABC transporter ATP-binding protein [Solirubrobacteraceae bacterium]|jgi:ABC-type multidrug transport system ATPase subunit
MTEARPDLVEIEGLGRSFGAREVIRRLDLRVPAGARVALRGPNGAGKSTALRCVAGTLAPTRGTVAIDGFAAGSVPARRRIGVSFAQERSFHMRLNGRANLIFFAQLHLGSRRAAVREVDALIEELDLREIAPRRLDQCSTGMVQQLAIARALSADPDVLLLDEPTRSLDKEAIARFWAAIDRRPDAAVLIATHRDEDLERCGSIVDFPT